MPKTLPWREYTDDDIMQALKDKEAKQWDVYRSFIFNAHKAQQEVDQIMADNTPLALGNSAEALTEKLDTMQRKATRLLAISRLADRMIKVIMEGKIKSTEVTINMIGVSTVIKPPLSKETQEKIIELIQNDIKAEIASTYDAIQALAKEL